MVTIKSISKQIRGVSYTPRDVSDVPLNNHIRLLRANNITEIGIDLTDTVFVNKNCISETQKLKVGDILIAASSGSIRIVGKAILIEDEINSSFGAFCKVIRPTEKVDYRYLSYYFRSSEYRQNISNLAAGANINNLRNEDLDNLEIPLPPLPIQKRIAEILDAADALKRKDQELLKKYDELAQAIFIDMFGDPVKNEKGWEVKKLGEEFKSIRYGTGSPPEYSESGIPFLRATNVKAGRIERKGMVFLTQKEAQKIAKCFVNEGDLIIVRSGANTGDCAYIPSEYANCLAGYDLIVEMEKVKSRFYNFFLNSVWGKAIIEKLSRRAGQPHLNSEQVSNIECIAPVYSQLEKFKLEIDAIEALRKLSIETHNVSDNLFQTLLQKAFNGGLVK